MQINEQWKRIVIKGNMTAYEVSSFGRIRRAEPGKGTYAGRILKHRPDKNGYRIIGIWIGDGYVLSKVHRLVVEAFCGPRNNRIVNHKDCDKANNNLSNLEWTDPSGNMKHSYAHGRKHWTEVYREKGLQFPKWKIHRVKESSVINLSLENGQIKPEYPS